MFQSVIQYHVINVLGTVMMTTTTLTVNQCQVREHKQLYARSVQAQNVPIAR